MSKVEELRKKLNILDANSSNINLYEDAISKLESGHKLEFWFEIFRTMNLSARLTPAGLDDVYKAIINDLAVQILRMTKENNKIRKELGEHEND